eukprot:gene2268-2483_t
MLRLFQTSRLSLATPSPSFALQQVAGFKWKPPRTAGRSTNLHRSNRAKEGLYHGKDIRFGCSISHSHHRSNRCWKPNVQNKRLWSDALNEWVRFKITTAAIKAVDNYGGIDNYMLALDERLVQDSNYLIKVRGLIAAAVYHKGELSPKLIKRLGFHKNPPLPPAAAEVQAVAPIELA